MDWKSINTLSPYGDDRFLGEKPSMDNTWSPFFHWDIKDDISEVPPMTRGSSSRSASSSVVHCVSCDYHWMSPCPCHLDLTSLLKEEPLNRCLSPKQFLPVESYMPPWQSEWNDTCNEDTLPNIPNSPPVHNSYVVAPPCFSAEASFGRIDSEYSDDGSEEDYDTDEDDDKANQLSRGDDELEAILFAATGRDLEMTAHLVPILHKSIYEESIAAITDKIDPWRDSIQSHSGTEVGQTPSSSTQTLSSGTNRRKRQRDIGSRGSSGDGDPNNGRDDDHDGDGDHDPKRAKDNADDGRIPRLACLFNKRYPAKYRTQHDATEGPERTKYRACEGPGFASIQRLKEHLKRKHYPVQCDRCYEIFPGSDRAKSVVALEAHRQLATPCERKEATLKEGISDSQWAQLEKKSSSKQRKDVPRVEKWLEMWDILFPNVPRPKTPWYDIENNETNLPPTTLECQRFGDIFSAMLDRQVLDQRILFQEGQDQEMKARLSVLAQTAFSIYSQVQPIVSSSSSSISSKSYPATSLLSGLYATSTPATTDDMSTMHSREAQTARIDMMEVPSIPRGINQRTTSYFMAPPAVPYRSSSRSAEAPGIASARPEYTVYRSPLPPNSDTFAMNERNQPSPWNPADPWSSWDSLVAETAVRSDTNHTSLPSIHETLMGNRKP